MRKVFKLIRCSMLVILFLVAGLILFLFSYYTILENRLEKNRGMLEIATGVLPDEVQSDTTTSAGMLNLIPVPRKVQITGGVFRLPSTLVYSITDSLREFAASQLSSMLDVKTVFSSRKSHIVFIHHADIPVQGYTLNIRPEKINVGYSSRQGLYYALVSLKVLNRNYIGAIPCVTLEDHPDLAVRGMMLDISRDKVPTLKTMKEIVQLLADLKYNHFQLYIEGFSFAYPSFRELWEGKETPVTGEEIRLLDDFCRDRFIDLVPNQNSLGHMMAWLATDRYADLAECPGGYKVMGLMDMKGTLDPNDPRSIELVTRMTDDLLPNFTSGSFNVNLDEPLELGQGKSKKQVEEEGVGDVYFDYMMKLYDTVTVRKKKMLMWGDIVLSHPEIIPRIPGDITLLDWGYEAGYPFERNCRTLQDSKLSFMVCPGTSSWASITGRTDNMLKAIESAAVNGARYGAKGMLMTDWGDLGHWQYLPVSFAGYTVGAALSWNSATAGTMPLTDFLSSYIFQDESGIMGELALDLGRYDRFEELPLVNMTTTLMALQFGMRNEVMVHAIYAKITDGIHDFMQKLAPELVSAYQERYHKRHRFDYKGLDQFLNKSEAMLSKTRLQSADSLLILSEFRNAIRLVRLGAALQYYSQERKNMRNSDQKLHLKAMQELGQRYLSDNQQLWLMRNKEGGYERSTGALNLLMQQIEDRLNLAEKSPIARGLYRFFEKITAAGVVLYLKLSS